MIDCLRRVFVPGVVDVAAAAVVETTVVVLLVEGRGVEVVGNTTVGSGSGRTQLVGGKPPDGSVSLAKVILSKPTTNPVLVNRASNVNYIRNRE